MRWGQYRRIVLCPKSPFMLVDYIIRPVKKNQGGYLGRWLDFLEITSKDRPLFGSISLAKYTIHRLLASICHNFPPWQTYEWSCLRNSITYSQVPNKQGGENNQGLEAV